MLSVPVHSRQGTALSLQGRGVSKAVWKPASPIQGLKRKDHQLAILPSLSCLKAHSALSVHTTLPNHTLLLGFAGHAYHSARVVSNPAPVNGGLVSGTGSWAQPLPLVAADPLTGQHPEA